MEKKTSLIIISMILAVTSVLTFYSLSTGVFVKLQVSFIESFILAETFSELSLSLIGIIKLVMATIILALMVSLMSVYNVLKDNRNIAMIPYGIFGIVSLIIFNLSLLSFFMLISSLLIGIYQYASAKAFYKEFKKWKFFRTGSKAISQGFMIFNLLVAVGTGLTIYVSHSEYSQLFHDSLENTIEKLQTNELENSLDNMYPNLTEKEKTALMKQMKKNMPETDVSNSQMIKSYIKWLPLLSAVTIWIFLEFLRSTILSLIGGTASAGAFRAFAPQ